MKNIIGKRNYYDQFYDKSRKSGDTKIQEDEKNIYKEALANALDIRKFEIEMYWKRTAYFWAITAVAIGGYFALLTENTNSSDSDFLAYLVAGVGLIFSLGWYLVNRGSKYWQRNWELHVDLLEDKVYGSLYKLNINPSQFHFLNLIRAYRISVSRINQILSLFVVSFWLYLFASHIFNSFINNNKFIIVSIGTIFYVVLLILGSRFKKSLIHKADFILREYE